MWCVIFFQLLHDAEARYCRKVTSRLPTVSWENTVAVNDAIDDNCSSMILEGLNNKYIKGYNSWAVLPIVTNTQKVLCTCLCLFKICLLCILRTINGLERST